MPRKCSTLENQVSQIDLMKPVSMAQSKNAGVGSKIFLEASHRARRPTFHHLEFAALGLGYLLIEIQNI